jgi:hypothetical protein
LEARRRRFGTETMRDGDVRELATFREQLKADNTVIDYDPHTEAGFLLVARESSDSDIVRQPTEAAQLQRRARG